MKLNLLPYEKPVSPPKPALPTGWESPIGWWQVEYESGTEGGDYNLIGTYFGHFAEVVFGISQNYGWKYRVTPSKTGILQKSPLWTAKRKRLLVGIPDGFNLRTFQNWLDTEDVVVKEGNLYKSFELQLANHLIK